jgi:hypothetical protein
MAVGAAIGDRADMPQIRSALPHNAVAPKHNAGDRAEPGADVTDPADQAIRDRDEVEDSSAASFPASDPPSWWSGR